MAPRNIRTLATVQDEAVTRLCRTRFEAFVELAWPILEPGTSFQSNWHISLIAEHLEAVTAGDIRYLVINMPPRHGKSLLTSVFWPVWEWIQYPSRRFLCVSHSESLAHKHSLDRRLLLQHRSFRQRFPHVRLARDQHAKAEFHNTRRGVMMATSMGGPVTGKGGDRLILDDPHSPEQVESDLQRQHVLDRFRMSLSTRLDDKGQGAIVLVMQRLHTEDLTDLCLGLGFEHLCLPALAPTRTTIVFPRSGRTIIREEDEPLWPAREPREELDRQKITMGPYSFSGQYQQAPVPRTGGLFPREAWKFYDALPTDETGQWIQAWDVAFKGEECHDSVVGVVGLRVGALVYLVDRFKAKATFTETCKAIQAMKARYPQTSAILIEDAANGAAIVDTLSKEIPGVIAVSPAGGKLARAHSAQPQIEAGQVLLPNYHTPTGVWRADRVWVMDIIDVCAAFPRGREDDDVDALTHLLLWCRQHPYVEPAGVMRPPDPLVTHRFRIIPPPPGHGVRSRYDENGRWLSLEERMRRWR
jgi:predicted phage terminase large subunit-like protein